MTVSQDAANPDKQMVATHRSELTREDRWVLGRYIKPGNCFVLPRPDRYQHPRGRANRCFQLCYDPSWHYEGCYETCVGWVMPNNHGKPCSDYTRPTPDPPAPLAESAHPRPTTEREIRGYCHWPCSDLDQYAACDRSCLRGFGIIDPRPSSTNRVARVIHLDL